MKILIVGGGIAGLATAAFLRRRTSHQVELVERGPLLSDADDYGIAVASNGVALMRLLCDGEDLYQELQAKKLEQVMMRRETNDGNVAALPFPDFGAPFLFCRRKKLIGWLLKKVQHGVGQIPKLHHSIRIVKVDVKDGTAIDDVGRRYVGDLVVCADGIDKTGRRAVLAAQNRLDSDTVAFEKGSTSSSNRWTEAHCAYMTTAPASFLNSRQSLRFLLEKGCLVNWFYDEPNVAKDDARRLQRKVVAYPLDDKGNHQIFGYLPTTDELLSRFESSENTQRRVSIANNIPAHEAVAAFEPFHKDLRDLLSCHPTTDLCLVRDSDPLPSWRAAKAILIGDAAHAAAPHAGQGSAQAFEDAETLSHFMSHLALEEALDRFEQARKPRAHYVQSTGRVLNGCLSIDGWNEHHYYTTIYTWKGCGMT